jgi:hypothetical protein
MQKSPPKFRESKNFPGSQAATCCIWFLYTNECNPIKVRLSIMAKDVLCEVNSCRHWAQENKCNASSIYIVSHASKEASESAETDCKTFEVK